MHENVDSQTKPANDSDDMTAFVAMNQSQAYEQWITTHPSQLLMLCAEFGMGRTTLLGKVSAACAMRQIPYKYMDFFGMSAADTLSSMNELQRWSRRKKKRKRNDEPRSVLACDNVPIGDESDVEHLANILRRMVSGGHSIVMATLPEGELLAERFGAAQCLWSCDLRVQRQAEATDDLLFEEYTQGIPLLANAYSKIEPDGRDSIATDPRYQAPYISVVESCVYSNMMGEEKRLRCAMLLLGMGTYGELKTIMGNIDEVLWRLTPRDCLLFGVDVTRGTFSCVGSQSLDCLNVAYASLSQMVRPWPALVARVAQLLANRGDLSRAAIVSLMCTDEERRCAIGLRWGSRMIDVGEVTVVADALELAHTQGYVDLVGRNEAESVLGALLDKHPKPVCLPPEEDGEQTLLRHARLALRCRDMARGKAVEEGLEARASDDAHALAIITFARSFRLLVSGKLCDSYELLLNRTMRREGSTISYGLTEMNYELCSLLLGIVPNSMDVESMRKTMLFFERAGLPQLNVYFDACIEAGSLLSGRLRHEGRLEVALQRSTRFGNNLWRGMLLIAMGVSDMRIGAYTRAHVRFEQAETTLSTIQAAHKALLRIALLLHCAVRAQLGERISRSDFGRCRGISKLHDEVVAMLASAVMKERPRRFSLSGGWGTTSRSREVHWLVNVLSNDCGSVSKQFRKVVPTSWLDAQTRIAGDVDEFYEAFAAPEDSSSSAQTVESVGVEVRKMASTHRVTVRMLGGFEVYVDGSIVPTSRLEQRRAKALLALLTALPGHVARRYEIMESVWPSHDYDSANKCVYSATSALRAEIGTLLGDAKGTPLILANKAQGTVSLNMGVFGTDVDLFEEAARRILDMDELGRQTIALCREIEDIYRGDLFVPPTDGMGLMGARARELRSLYVDAMIVGARAAVSLGMKTMACRFAHKAFDADDLREDGMRTLVTALCSAGRHVEAQKAFERFVGRVVDFTRQPPSRRLREDVEALLKDSAKTEARRPSRTGRQAQPGQLSLALD